MYKWNLVHPDEYVIPLQRWNKWNTPSLSNSYILCFLCCLVNDYIPTSQHSYLLLLVMNVLSDRTAHVCSSENESRGVFFHKTSSSEPLKHVIYHTCRQKSSESEWLGDQGSGYSSQPLYMTPCSISHHLIIFVASGFFFFFKYQELFSRVIKPQTNMWLPVLSF